jgi:hypothetical protein
LRVAFWAQTALRGLNSSRLTLASRTHSAKRHACITEYRSTSIF